MDSHSQYNAKLECSTPVSRKDRSDSASPWDDIEIFHPIYSVLLAPEQLSVGVDKGQPGRF